MSACTGDDNPNTTAAEDETGISTGDGDPTTGDGDGDGDGDPTTTGDGDGDGDGDDTGPDCGTVQIAPKYTPPNVLLVVDASGSMVGNSWDHDLDPNTPVETRWSTLYGVVDTVMTQFGASINAGLQRFPSEAACDQGSCYNATACIVSNTPEVGVAFDNGAAILASMPPANDDGTSVEGGTPATRGINSAVNHLTGLAAGIPNYILLITDGAANCNEDAIIAGVANPIMENYDEALTPTVQAAFADDNIPTFVVGIDIVDMLVGVGADGSPEANPFERLNEVALAGGVPKNMGMDAEKFFNSTNEDELLLALSEIIDDITECTIDLTMTEEGPPDESQIDFVTFTSNGEDVPFLDPSECDTMDGWTWIEEGLIMTFCGSYCDDFKTGGAVFDGTYGCPPAG